MIETLTAVMGLVSAGIFIAHAFDGFRSRAWVFAAWVSGRLSCGWPEREPACPLRIGRFGKL